MTDPEQTINDLVEKCINLQKERENLRDTLREVQLRLGEFYHNTTDITDLIQQVLEGYPIGKYILIEECNARIQATKDDAEKGMLMWQNAAIDLINQL